jgi:hypothetical protein
MARTVCPQRHLGRQEPYLLVISRKDIMPCSVARMSSFSQVKSFDLAKSCGCGCLSLPRVRAAANLFNSPFPIRGASILTLTRVDEDRHHPYPLQACLGQFEMPFPRKLDILGIVASHYFLFGTTGYFLSIVMVDRCSSGLALLTATCGLEVGNN